MTTTTIKLTRPHSDQLYVRKNLKRFNVLTCGRRWGKTKLLEELCALPAIHGYPVGYFAPRYKLLSEFWRSMSTLLAPITVERRDDERIISLMGGGSLEAWTLEDPDAGRSRKYKRIVIDEAGLIRNLRNKWSAALRPTLADLRGDAIFAGTPQGIGTDFEWLFNRHTSAPSQWASFQRKTEYNPFIDPAEIAAMREELGDLFAAQEVDALFVDVSGAEKFIPHPSLWDACNGFVEQTLWQPEILALDAAVSGDSFAAVAVSRHPDPKLADHVVERWTRIWKPTDFEDGIIDQATIELELITYCERHNVVCMVYDPYQAHYLATRLSVNPGLWVDPFNQGAARLEADRQLLDVIVARRFHHSGSLELRTHVLNSYRKPDPDGHKLRIVKGSPDLKIDACVALSMSTAKCLELNLF